MLQKKLPCDTYEKQLVRKKTQGEIISQKDTKTLQRSIIEIAAPVDNTLRI